MTNPPDIKTLMPRLLAARAKWEKLPPPDIVRQIPEPHQESVWDYPHPPEIRPAEATVLYGGSAEKGAIALPQTTDWKERRLHIKFGYNLAN